MALNAKKIQAPAGGDRVEQDNLEAGVYRARIVQILDYGVQPQRAYAGKDKAPAQEIGVTYELLDEFMKDEDGNEIEDKPRWISENFPLHSLKADMAKSTKRYQALDPKEVHEGNWPDLIGMPCMVTVVNNPGKEGKVYDNVGNVSAMRPKDAANAPELVNDPKVFDLDDPDMEVFAKLPKWIQDKIASNLNFKGSALEKAIGGGAKEEGVVKKIRAAAGKAEKAAAIKDEGTPPFDTDEEDNPY